MRRSLEVSAMAVEGLDILARLEAHCLPNLKYEDKRLLILNVFLTAAQIARLDDTREETVKAHIRHARVAVELALEEGESMTHGLAAFWVACHRGDCLQDAFERLHGETG